MKRIIHLLIFVSISLSAAGCASSGSFQRGSAIAAASERTLCTAALLTCDLSNNSKCLDIATKACAKTPKLIDAWVEVAKPVSDN